MDSSSFSSQSFRRKDSDNSSIHIIASPSSLSTVGTPPPQLSQLGDFFGNGREHGIPYSDRDVQEIVHHLEGQNQKAWSQAPRLYIVLRTIGQLALFDPILERDIRDDWFPFDSKSVPTPLSSVLHSDFLETQRLVLTKAVDLEKNVDKPHLHFGRNEIFPFDVVEHLGKGGSSTVDRVVSHLSHREFARKLFRRPKGGSKGEIKHFRNELKVFKRIHHRHCVELVASYTDSKYFGIIMSPVADCNLHEFFSRAAEDPGKMNILRRSFGCLSSAMNYLHQNQIKHRDIKPENILIKGSNVYLADFGISLDWQTLSRCTTIDDAGKTPIYCAPEVANGKERNQQADIWSLGCVFFEMCLVLNDKTIAAVRTHLKNESGSSKYHDNISGISHWIDQLRLHGSEAESAPLSWTDLMLQIEPKLRPSPYDLYVTICSLAPNSGSKEARFCAECCAIDEVPRSSDDSASDSEMWAADSDEEASSPTLIDGNLESASNNVSLAVINSMVEPLETPIEIRPLVDSQNQNIGQSATSATSSIRHGQNSAQDPNCPSYFPVAAPQPVHKDLKEMINRQDNVEEEQTIIIQTPQQWPHYDLQGFMPDLKPIDWTKPSRILHSVKEDYTFMQNLRSKSSEAYTLVSKAEIKDVTALVRLLIQNGLALNSTAYLDSQGWTPLCHVVEWGDAGWESLITFMIQTGAQLDIEGRHRKPKERVLQPFELAARQGNVSVMKIMWYAENRPPGWENTMVIVAALDRIDAMSFLLERGVEATCKDVSDQNALFIASRCGHERALLILLQKLQKQVDIDQDLKCAGKTPLQIASENGHLKVVTLLISHGAQPDRESLCIASEKGHFEVVQELLRKPISLDVGFGFEKKDLLPPLYAAARGNHPKLVALLLRYDRGFQGSSLRIASKRGHIEVVRAFLRWTEEVSLDVNRLAFHAVFEACCNNHLEVARLLLEHGAYPNVCWEPWNGSQKSTCLYYATKNQNADMVKLLLDKGALVSKSDHVLGNVVMKKAQKWGNVEIIGLLAGAKAREKAHASSNKKKGEK